MICPKDGAQLNQYKKMGCGSSDEEFYDTMEIKVCPVCDGTFIEAYTTFALKDWVHFTEHLGYLKRFDSDMQSLIMEFHRSIVRRMSRKSK